MESDRFGLTVIPFVNMFDLREVVDHSEFQCLICNMKPVILTWKFCYISTNVYNMTSRMPSQNGHFRKGVDIRIVSVIRYLGINSTKKVKDLYTETKKH